MRETTIKYVDDLDGSAADGPVTFGVDGRHYEIDLSGPNSERLRDALAPFVAAGRRSTADRPRRRHRAKPLEPSPAWKAAGWTPPAPPTRRPAAVRRDPEQTRAMRRWAQANGYTVSDRGRIPAAVEHAYNEAHQRGGRSPSRV